jgi:antirestriction protein ArdC
LSYEAIVEKFPKYEISVVESISDGMAKWDSNMIAVAARKNKSQMIASLFHEMAHHKLDHTNTKSSRFEKMTFSERKEVVELEAEATAYLVCSCIGIERKEGSAAYISNWRGNAERLDRSARAVMKVAEEIINTVAKEKA